MNRMLVIALALVSGRATAGLPTPRGESVLCARQRGYAVEAYQVQGTPEQALAEYARTLQGNQIRVRTIQGALAVRGRETAIVHAFRVHDRTVLSVVRLGDEEQASD